ncbi:tyrosine-type recombinase/integrase [Streptococcus sp. 116-D4]|uniref:tyrosine-type recombinase/integrase n=1 Tax=Streptococcus sp. 116-D4 TaxID=2598453 RepID=UPI0012B4AF6C|nr:site-specific integrase [Streptococcus sp. 116-D4]BBP09885.1 putative integrase - phage associated [Streptococcus sp. 116-D4]
MWMEELPNGKYKFFERYKDPYTEKWKRVSVTLDSGSSRAKKEAQKLLDERLEETLKKLQTTDIVYEHVLNEWWAFYQKELKGSSISSLTSNVNDFKETFDLSVKVSNIDTKYIQRFLNNLDLSRSKMERYKLILNLSLDYAVNLEYIEDNPARRAKLPKLVKTIEDLEKTEKKFLEEDELKRLLSELYRTDKTYRLGLLAEFMAYNGCRIGEAIALREENVDFDSKTVKIHGTLDKTVGYSKGLKTTTKTAASFRTVSLSKRELEILKEFISINELSKNTRETFNDLGFIFVTKNGIPIQNNSFNLAIQKANNRLKNPIDKHLTSHIFRHTLVSRLSENNVPLKAIMARVGHSDSRTTNKIYTHVTKKMDDNILDLLDNL